MRECWARIVTVDIEVLRVTDDPDLTPDSVVYEITEPDDLNPEWPVRFRIDITDEYPVLSSSQPGPWIVPASTEEMSLDLETLVRLGEVAAALLARSSSAKGDDS